MTEASTTVLYVQEYIKKAEGHRDMRYVVILREWSAKLTDAIARDSVVHHTILTIWGGKYGAYQDEDVYWDREILMPSDWRRWQSQRFAMSVFDKLVADELTDADLHPDG